MIREHVIVQSGRNKLVRSFQLLTNRHVGRKCGKREAFEREDGNSEREDKTVEAQEDT